MDFSQILSARIGRRQAIGATTALAAGIALAPAAHAQRRILGTVVDYAAGVPSAQSIKNAGHLGAVRYVSGRRPGTETWMLGKPVTATETRNLASLGLATASVYQFGKDSTADWKQGARGAAIHVPQAIAHHVAAGGPTGRPIYMAIDDNPTQHQYTSQIRPYLQACKVALEAAGYQLGIYGNYNTIAWAIADGLGQYFWQHNWGSGGNLHPRAQLHQVRIDKDKIDGVGIDINHVYATDWGQWTPGNIIVHPAPAAPGSAPAPGPAPALPHSSIPGSSQATVDALVQQATQAAHLLGRASGIL